MPRPPRLARPSDLSSVLGGRGSRWNADGLIREMYFCEGRTHTLESAARETGAEPRVHSVGALGAIVVLSVDINSGMSL